MTTQWCRQGQVPLSSRAVFRILLALAAVPSARSTLAQGTSQFQVVSLPPCQSAGQFLDVDVSTALSVTPGSPDPRWFLSLVPTNQTGAFQAFSTIPNVAWSVPPPNVHWVQRMALGSPQIDSGGYYGYRLGLNLNPSLYTGLHVVGVYSADNEVSVKLNGITQTSCTGNGCFSTPQSLNVTSGFVNGLNQLDFVVNNFSNVTGLMVAAKLQATCQACVAAPTGMVAWYPLDEHAGATSVDDIAPPPDSLVDNAGTPLPGPIGPISPNMGPAPVVGLVGNHALYFWGPYVEVPPQAELNFGAGDFSIDAWIRAVGCGPGRLSPIVDKLDTGTNTGFSFYLDQPVAGQATLNLRVNASTFASTGTLPATANPIANTGPWVHVAVTIERAIGLGTFYINGSQAGTFTPPPGSVSNSKPMWIGEIRLPGARCEIAIDELEIFNRALSAQEVAGIYGAGSAGKCRPHPDVPSDLGDAPDSTNHAGAAMLAYPSPPVTAHFPTVHDPSLGGWRGPKHLSAKSALWLGADVTFEDEADVGGDQDGVNNIDASGGSADHDNRDDGVNPNAVLLPACGSTQLPFDLSAAGAAPAGNYYVNVWFDFTRDGDWDDSFRCAVGPSIDAHGQEWAVQNMVVSVPGNLAQGGFATFTTPPFVSLNPDNSPLWMRVTVSDQPVLAGDNGGPFTLPADLGRGGSAGTTYLGGYASGETEDYLLAPRIVELCGVKWNDADADGVQQQGEPGLPGWQIEVSDAAGNLVATATTDAQGAFCVVVPAPGPKAAPITYTIAEAPQAGWVQTFPPNPGTYTVTVNPGPPLSLSPAGPYRFGNRAIVTGTCDLGLRKSVAPDPLVSGQPATFTLAVTNVGSADCQGFTTLTDTLPAGLVLTGVDTGNSAWSCAVIGANPPATVSCSWDPNVKPVPPGPLPAVALTVEVAAPPGTAMRNCATVTNPNDTNPGNDASCTSVVAPRRVARHLGGPR